MDLQVYTCLYFIGYFSVGRRFFYTEPHVSERRTVIIDGIPEVRYEIFEPNSCLTTNPKCYGARSTIKIDWRRDNGINCSKKSFQKSNGHRKRRLFGVHTKSDLNLMTSQYNNKIEVELCDQHISDFNESDQCDDEYAKFTSRGALFDFICMPAAKTKKKESKREKYAGIRYTCPCGGVLKSSFNIQQKISNDFNFNPSQIPRDDIKYDEDVFLEYSVQISSLDNIIRYKNVIMGDSTPPRFVIDITKNIDLHHSTWQRSIYIVFQMMNDVQNNHTLTNAVKIIIKSDFNSVQKSKLSKIMKEKFSQIGHSHVQMDLLIDHVTALVLSVLRDPSNEHGTVIGKEYKASDRKSPSFTILKSVLGWDFKSYDSSQAYQTITDQNEMTYSNRMCLNHLQMRTISDKFCDVCYTPILENMFSVSTELKKCSHQFCNQCWLHHLTEKIRRRDTHLTCMGYKCETELNKSDILSLVPYSLYLLHHQHCMDILMETSKKWKWCPRTRCDRIIKAEMSGCGAVLSDVACIQCNCGEIWCFVCQEAAHWPATCEQAKRHQQLLEQSKTETKTYFVEAKRCPSCSYPIEKSGGCQHMVCGRCHFDFCWVCLQEWRYHGGSLRCPTEEVPTSTYELNNSRTLSTKKCFTELAVKHHQKRASLPVDKQGLVTVARRMAQRKGKTRCTYRKTADLPRLCNPVYGCEREMKLLTNSYSFIKEACFIL